MEASGRKEALKGEGCKHLSQILPSKTCSCARTQRGQLLTLLASNVHFQMQRQHMHAKLVSLEHCVLRLNETQRMLSTPELFCRGQWGQLPVQFLAQRMWMHLLGRSMMQYVTTHVPWSTMHSHNCWMASLWHLQGLQRHLNAM